MIGSKRVDHWTSGTVYESSEIAGSTQGSNPVADCVSCEAGRRTAVSVSTPLGIEPRSLMTGSKRVDHWTSGSVYECSEIAGSLQYCIILFLSDKLFDCSAIFNSARKVVEPFYVSRCFANCLNISTMFFCVWKFANCSTMFRMAWQIIYIFTRISFTFYN
jgi:hypothetical protein